jgi:hypothetical protein
MPKVSDIFGGPYLKAEHYRGKPQIWEITGFDIETVYGKDEHIIFLAGETKGIKLSATCATDIADVLGDDMERWPGNKMEFRAEDLTIKDRETQAEKKICMWRSRAPSGPANPKDPSDDIPF